MASRSHDPFCCDLFSLEAASLPPPDSGEKVRYLLREALKVAPVLLALGLICTHGWQPQLGPVQGHSALLARQPPCLTGSIERDL